MDYLTFIKNEGLVFSDNINANAIALPSIKNIKYLISLKNKDVFYAGLNLLSTRSIKARMSKIVLKVLYRFGLIKSLLKNNLLSLDEECSLITLIHYNYPESLGINVYVGSAKNHNLSLTMQIIDPDKNYFLRYPITESSKAGATNEFKNLNLLQINASNSYAQKIHKIIEHRGSDLYSYEGIENSHTTTGICKTKISLLKALTQPDYVLLNDNAFFQESCRLIEEMLSQSENKIPIQFKQIFTELSGELSLLSIKKAFYHGDFSPDNLLISGNDVYLIDFEYSSAHFVSCFDVFHYLFKANNTHRKNLSLDDVTAIYHFIEETYQEVPVRNLETSNKKYVVFLLYMFYLFMMLKRYIIDEGITSDSIVKTYLLNNIQNVSDYCRDLKI